MLALPVLIRWGVVGTRRGGAGHWLTMAVFEFNPYAAERAAVWRNRVAYWRGHPPEALFHAVGAALATALLVAALISARGSLIELVSQLFGHYLSTTLATLAVASALSQHQARRRQRLVWSDDWLAAQPMAARLRQRLRWQALLGRLMIQLALLVGALWLAQVPSASGVAATLLLVVGGVAGHLVADQPWRHRPQHATRQLPRPIGGRGSLWRWQLAESAAVLAPRRLAWLLLLILLVPRGPAMMILPAIALVLLGALAHAWQRALQVIPAAQQLLAAQPLAAGSWLRGALAWPLLLLTLTTAGVSLLAGLLGAVALAWLCALVLPALALLQLACTTAERQSPRRAAWLFFVQCGLSIAVWQAMPLLGAPLWLAQMLWLWRRSR